MNSLIRVCTLDDAEMLTKHCITHMKEKGIGGVYAHPFPMNHKWDEVEFLGKIVKQLSLPEFAPNWTITWVAVHEGKFVGHLNLRCGGIDAQKHRYRLGMGIINDYRSQGIGKAMLQMAIEWAREQEQIEWIDLNVFTKNLAAQKLYKSFGFEELFTIKDALRVDGESIDDIQMVLKV